MRGPSRIAGAVMPSLPPSHSPPAAKPSNGGMTPPVEPVVVQAHSSTPSPVDRPQPSASRAVSAAATATEDAAPTAVSAKVQPLEQLAALIAEHKAAGRVVVHCHGVFDLLHIGHIKYLEAAARMGDVLVVTLTADEHVNKGPNRPAFPQPLRAEALAALGCVDHVAINRWPTAVETIQLLRPNIYVKGSEYREADQDVTGAIVKERDAVEAVGGQLAFTDEITFSSSNLLNRHMPALPEEVRLYLEGFTNRHSIDQVLGTLDAVRDMKVLIVGETIIDEYQYCEAIGKSSKEPTLVVKAGTNERFAGGILAVANHVAAFCGQVTLLTQIGDRNSHEGFIRQRLHHGLNAHLLTRRDSPTIVKRRYIDGYFFSKLLEIYEINDGALHPDDDAVLCDRITELAPQHDLVIVADFGHSMISAQAVDAITEHSQFLALNTQANAGNMGYHTLSKYPRAELICVAENEMRLEARDRRGDLHDMVTTAARQRGCEHLFVTRGKRGCLGYTTPKGPGRRAGDETPFTEVPAVASKIVDRVGAGDTFLSLVAPLIASGKVPVEVAGFLGNVAGAEAVATVGHSRYLDRKSLMKHVQTLLK